MKVLCRRVALTLSVVTFANSSIQRAERRAICLSLSAMPGATSASLKGESGSCQTRL